MYSRCGCCFSCRSFTLITSSIAGKGNNTNNILSSDNSSKKTTTADNKDIPSVGSTDVIEDTN